MHSRSSKCAVRMLPLTKESTTFPFSSHHSECCDFRMLTNLFGDLDEWFFGCAYNCAATHHISSHIWVSMWMKYEDVNCAFILCILISALMGSVVLYGNRLNTGIGPHKFIVGTKGRRSCNTHHCLTVNVTICFNSIDSNRGSDCGGSDGKGPIFGDSNSTAKRYIAEEK